MIKLLGHTALGFAVGVVVVLGFYFFAHKAEAPTPLQENTTAATTTRDTTTTRASIQLPVTAPVVSTSDQLTVHDQKSGASVLAAYAQAQNDGWLVVHEEKDGTISNALGAARIDAGTHEAVTIPLLRNTADENRYWVVLYNDNGDRTFSLAHDTPEKDTNGEPIMTAFITVTE